VTILQHTKVLTAEAFSAIAGATLGVHRRSGKLSYLFATPARGPVNVCGISVLTRKNLVSRRFGSDAWGQFFRDVAGTHSCFRSLITADTRVPLHAFLGFHDELMRRFFKDEERSYLELGRESSRWAIGDGPLKKVLEGLDIGGVITALPKFHDLYFKDATTRAEAALTGSSVEFTVRDLPHWHPYFEHFVVGYIAEILEMYCANPIRAVRLRGGAGKEYRYLLHGAPSNGAELLVSRSRELSATDVGKYLSNRELDVLVLVAHGHTNEGIGEALGISKKTVQHHVARACRKIGVTGRVGAAVWLAERGLVDG
jgi:DNA-binding CsgD family transcriptional regulator